MHAARKRDLFPRVVPAELGGRVRVLQSALVEAGLLARVHAGGELAHEEALRWTPESSS
jgi:hypothetical protein